MTVESLEIVIQGVTESGAPFRPSDWAERLCGMMSIFGEDHHLSYSPYLKPIRVSGSAKSRSYTITLAPA